MITLGETIKNLPNLSTSFQFNSLHILWAPPCSFTWKKAVGLAFLATRVSWQIGRVVKRYRPPTAQQSISGVPLDFPGRGMIAVVILWHVLMLHYPPTHFLYKFRGVNPCINCFFYAPVMFLIYLHLPEDLDFIEESEFIVTIPRRIL